MLVEKFPQEKPPPEKNQNLECQKTKCKDDLEKLSLEIPSEPFGIVKATFVMLGVCSMMAVIFFIIANEYWMYKFRDITSNSTNADDRTGLQANFTSTYGIVSSVPNVIVVFIFTFVGHKVNANPKIYAFFATIIVVMALQALFVDVNTDGWQVGFFVLTMVTVAIMSGFTSVGMVSLLSIVSKFPHEYMHYFLMGQGTSEICSALLRIFTLAVVPNFKASAVMYFLIGLGIFSVAAAMFFVASRTEFFKYYSTHTAVKPKEEIHSLSDIYDVLKDVWLVCLLFALMLIVPIHPSVTSLVVSEYKGSGSAWGETYFVPVVTYLFSAFCSISGRVTAAAFPKTITWPVVFTITALRSVVFPPMLILCNVKPKHNTPVVFPHDWQYATILGSYMFVSGYLMSVMTVVTIKSTTKEKLDTAFTLTMLCFFVVMACTSPIGAALVNLL